MHLYERASIISCAAYAALVLLPCINLRFSSTFFLFRMPLYELTGDTVEDIEPVSFSGLKLRERQDLQRIFRDRIEVICPQSDSTDSMSMMVLAEEFGSWEGSLRRIDLLCLDSNSNLVVVELKRDEPPGHHELQAVRYAAMISAMTFSQAVSAHERYREARGLSPAAAREEIYKFLGRSSEDDIVLSKEVRIVLVARSFSKEVATTVLWLNDQGLDITCVTVQPYSFQGRVLVNIEQELPLPEAAAYQIAIRDKEKAVAAVVSKRKDHTKYCLYSDSCDPVAGLPKRRLIWHVMKHALERGFHPDRIKEAVTWPRHKTFVFAEGLLSGSELAEALPSVDWNRYFSDDTDLFLVGNRTYALSNQWGDRTTEAVDNILGCLAEGHGIRYEVER